MVVGQQLIPARLGLQLCSPASCITLDQTTIVWYGCPWMAPILPPLSLVELLSLVYCQQASRRWEVRFCTLLYIITMQLKPLFTTCNCVPGILYKAKISFYAWERKFWCWNFYSDPLVQVHVWSLLFCAWNYFSGLYLLIEQNNKKLYRSHFYAVHV